MADSDWKQREATIAIAGRNGKWKYLRFSNWEEAREAVNQARSEGKAAVFYDGATLPSPPELPLNLEVDKD